MRFRLPGFLFILLHVITSTTGVVPGGGCLAVGGLARSQRRLCTKAPTASSAAIQGLKAAVHECQHQLRWHRWNCSTLAHKAANPHSAAILHRGYRETAFVYAIAAAGVAHSVARACAQGQLLACGCDPSVYRTEPPSDPHQDDNMNSLQPAAKHWKWGGCSHNIDYGMTFSKLFLDSRETAGDLQSRVNLHNNEAGRLAVANNMEVRCKCHGMSGSCQLKTCWRATPALRIVGKQLKRKFKKALMVDQSNLNSGQPRLARNRGGPKRRRRGPVMRANRNQKFEEKQPPGSLLFYERSPSFCEKDRSLDVPGTTGRRCMRSRNTPGACGALCCGRGHDLIRARKHSRCRCKFHWCCRVECDTCYRDEWVAICK